MITVELTRTARSETLKLLFHFVFFTKLKCYYDLYNYILTSNPRNLQSWLTIRCIYKRKFTVSALLKNLHDERNLHNYTLM